MANAIPEPDAVDDDVRMGSEYSDARTYLARTPRSGAPSSIRRNPKAAPQHGSNDSDFGMPDQKAE